jgi:signal transduction histidine kinase
VQFTEGFFQLTSIRCRLDVPEGMPRISFGTQQRHHVLLAVKEACNNVARHAGATEVWIRLRTSTAAFCIVIEDNGCGFVLGSETEGSDGLRNMGQRMAELGGRLEVQSEPGRGTSVKFHVPLAEMKSPPCPSE